MNIESPCLLAAGGIEQDFLMEFFWRFLIPLLQMCIHHLSASDYWPHWAFGAQGGQISLGHLTLLRALC